MGQKPRCVEPKWNPRATWTGIVKVRRRSAGTRVVILNEDHTINYRGGMDPQLVQWFGKHREIHAWAEIVDGIINLRKKAPMNHRAKNQRLPPSDPPAQEGTT